MNAIVVVAASTLEGVISGKIINLVVVRCAMVGCSFSHFMQNQINKCSCALGSILTSYVEAGLYRYGPRWIGFMEC